jgi:very-short-patch-repair endonuclease
MKIPRPKSFSSVFRIIEKNEKIPCECGKSFVANGWPSHSKKCSLAFSSYEKYAKEKRNGLLPGDKSLAFSRYYSSYDEYQKKIEQYRRVLKKYNRRNVCEVCNKLFFSSTIIKKRTCSVECQYKLMTQNHDYVSSSAKMGKTRIRNKIGVGKPSWNKGITGDNYLTHYQHDNETLDDAKKRLTIGRFKKTSIEQKIEDLLVELGVNFIHSAFVNRRQYDFKLVDKMILIEADGDYWHGNTFRYESITEQQEMKQKDDRIKDSIAFKYGYTILRFWESDINNDLETIQNLLKEVLKNESNKALREIEKNYTRGGGQYVRRYRTRQTYADC